MTFTSQQKRSLGALFLIGLLACLHANASAQNDDQAAVRRAVEQLFAIIWAAFLAHHLRSPIPTDFST
jgi:hypothetical protein